MYASLYALAKAEEEATSFPLAKAATLLSTSHPLAKASGCDEMSTQPKYFVQRSIFAEILHFALCFIGETSFRR